MPTDSEETPLPLPANPNLRHLKDQARDLVRDVLGDHRLAEALWGDEHDVARGAEEVEGARGFDERAVNLGWPIPVVVGDRLEATEVAASESSLEAPAAALALFDAGGNGGSGNQFGHLLRGQRFGVHY